MLVDQLRDERLAALDHHDERQLVLVHVLDVGAAKVSTIEYEADVAVLIRQGFVDEIAELTDIVDRSRVYLVEQRHLIGAVVCHSDVDDRRGLVIFGIAEFGKVNISGLRVLVGRVVGDVDALLMLAVGVPIFEETDDLLVGDVGQEPRSLSL